MTAHLRGEPNEMPALVGSFGAEDAWHLHHFAVDVRQAAENILEWARMVDEAAHGLYLHFNEPGQVGAYGGVHPRGAVRDDN